MEAGAPKQFLSRGDKVGVDVDQRTVRDLRVNFADSEHSGALLVVDWHVEAPFELEGNPVDADGANACEPIHIHDKILVRVSELAPHMCRNPLDISMPQEKRSG